MLSTPLIDALILSAQTPVAGFRAPDSGGIGQVEWAFARLCDQIAKTGTPTVDGPMMEWNAQLYVGRGDGALCLPETTDDIEEPIFRPALVLPVKPEGTELNMPVELLETIEEFPEALPVPIWAAPFIPAEAGPRQGVKIELETPVSAPFTPMDIESVEFLFLPMRAGPEGIDLRETAHSHHLMSERSDGKNGSPETTDVQPKDAVVRAPASEADLKITQHKNLDLKIVEAETGAPRHVDLADAPKEGSPVQEDRPQPSTSEGKLPQKVAIEGAPSYRDVTSVQIFNDNARGLAPQFERQIFDVLRFENWNLTEVPLGDKTDPKPRESGSVRQENWQIPAEGKFIVKPEQLASNRQSAEVVKPEQIASNRQGVENESRASVVQQPLPAPTFQAPVRGTTESSAITPLPHAEPILRSTVMAQTSRTSDGEGLVQPYVKADPAARPLQKAESGAQQVGDIKTQTGPQMPVVASAQVSLPERPAVVGEGLMDIVTAPSGGASLVQNPNVENPIRLVASDSAPVTRQIIAAVSGQSPGVTEIRLDPPELGRLRIDVTAEGEKVTLLITVERQETLDLLRRHLDRLTTDLRAEGFQKLDLGFGQSRDGEAETPRSAQASAPSRQEAAGSEREHIPLSEAGRRRLETGLYMRL